MICGVEGCGSLAVRIIEITALRRQASLCGRHAAIALMVHPGPVPDEEYEAVIQSMTGRREFEPPFTILHVGRAYEVWDICCRTVGEFDTLAEARLVMEKLTGA